ncbi:unnamed protein product [Sphagnum troendelagicum]|uniref:Uncharacterized protein n=1 Tax=Sphagnum troendelagicum TaxID=128251 RepID=A0ABP0V8G9_9BRYO
MATHKSACITVKGSRRGRGGGCCKKREQETSTSCFHEGNNSLHVIMVAGEPSRDLIWQSSYCISWASVSQTLCSLPVLAGNVWIHHHKPCSQHLDMIRILEFISTF